MQSGPEPALLQLRANYQGKAFSLNYLASPQAAANGKAVVFFAPKGGSGKTTLATNLALALATGGEGKVAVRSQNVGRDLDRAIGHAKDAGYDTVTVFEGRQARHELLG